MTFEYSGIIGIDIGSYQTKIIKMSNKFRDRKWAIAYIPEGLTIHNRSISEDLLAQHIKNIMTKNKIKGKKCSLCLPSHHIITKAIVLPNMDKQALQENIYYDIAEYLPLGLDNYIIDYKIMRSSYIENNEYWHILVVAALKDIVFTYIRVLEKADLKPTYIDIPSNCLHKLILNSCSPEKQTAFQDESHCLIDIGAVSSNISILNKGEYFVDKTIPFGSAGIVSILSNHYNIDERSSEQIMYEKDLILGTDPDSTIFEVRAYIQELIDEVIGVIRYFNNQMLDSNIINEIILFGGGAMLINLSAFLEREIGVDVTLFSDCVDSDYLSFEGLSKQDIMVLCNAIGSTIRETAL